MTQKKDDEPTKKGVPDLQPTDFDENGKLINEKQIKHFADERAKMLGQPIGNPSPEELKFLEDLEAKQNKTAEQESKKLSQSETAFNTLPAATDAPTEKKK